MITAIEIENYKSINKLKLDLGRVNVFIGENGAGKSNILEAIALAGAAAAEKLDTEFLSSRGIRVTNPEYMRMAFPGSNANDPIKINIQFDKKENISFSLKNENSTYAKWIADFDDLGKHQLNIEDYNENLGMAIISRKMTGPINKSDLHSIYSTLKNTIEILEKLKNENSNINDGIDRNSEPVSIEIEENVRKGLAYTFFKISSESHELGNFIIYSPENSLLRTFKIEGQIEPLGINGEGLLKLISFHSQEKNPTVLQKIKSCLNFLNWFVDFNIPKDNADGRLNIKDRYLDDAVDNIDHRSTNEGFFFLLFYFALFSSDLTPKFFAIDNIDASLNPKLCQQLMLELTKLAKENDKQAILTTHNPAILDGLDLDDDEQRLFVISRGRNGATRIKRIMKPVIEENQRPHKLSELFLRGVLGGLPKGF